MSNTSLHPHPAIVNRRFVAPLDEYEQGKARKPLSECVSDDMAQGWCDAADLAGALMYLNAMEMAGEPYPSEVM